jgi:hypothetical protein
MKTSILICVVFIAFVLVVYSEAVNNNDEQSLSRIKSRQIEDEDQSTDSQEDKSDEELEDRRRRSPQCEPCGVTRRPCCFPDLCQHRSSKRSKCIKVSG